MYHRLRDIPIKNLISEVQNEFQAELSQKSSSLLYYKNFVFRDSDIDKVKKTVQRGQIKFVDQLELEMRNLLHNYHCYYGSAHYSTQSKFFQLFHRKEHFMDFFLLRHFSNQISDPKNSVFDSSTSYNVISIETFSKVFNFLKIKNDFSI